MYYHLHFSVGPKVIRNNCAREGEPGDKAMYHVSRAHFSKSDLQSNFQPERPINLSCTCGWSRASLNRIRSLILQNSKPKNAQKQPDPFPWGEVWGRD